MIHFVSMNINYLLKIILDVKSAEVMSAFTLIAYGSNHNGMLIPDVSYSAIIINPPGINYYFLISILLILFILSFYYY